MNYEPTRVLFTGLRAPPTKEGVDVFHLPALEFRTLAFSISDVVAAIETCDAVCLYSQRAIESIEKEPRILRALLDRKPQLVVVGRKTGDAWQQKIDPRCDPETCRTFVELVTALKGRPDLETIVALELQDGPRSLARSNVPQQVTAFEVYATSRSVPDSRTWDEVTTFDPEWVAFTSPRGVRSFAKKIRELDTSFRIASIGPTTSSAIERAGLKVSVEAVDPSAEKLLEIIVHESI